MTINAFDFGDWDVESLRLSIFHPGDYESSHSPGLWESVTGQQVDSIDSRPRDRAIRAVGLVEGNNLNLTHQDGRVDWTLQPTAGVAPQPPNDVVVAKIGSVEHMLPIFQNALEHSLEAITSVDRIAFAPGLIREVPDINVGLEQLDKFLPCLNLTAAHGDLIYQINRIRRSESVRHARINRIAKWSLELVGGISFRVGPTGQPDVLPTSLQPVRRLLLDVNTTQTTSIMAKERIPGLFDELVTLASEIAIEGDTP